MKTKLAILLFFVACIVSCDDDEKIQDPVHEFISFAGDEAVDVGEATGAEGYPLVVQLWAFDPYNENITVNYEIITTNTAENVDFTATPTGTVTIPAGRLTSDTVWIKTINNDVPNDLERKFEVAITSVSKSDLKIGLGITEPKKKSITFKIIDDECSGDPRCVFNTALTNAISGPDGSWSDEKPATGVVDKLAGTIKVTGDLIAYGPFSGAELTITLTPDSEGSPTGTASFGEQETGADADGYEYKFIEVGTGSYNADAGTLKVEYDVYYMDGGWVYWYSVINEFSPN
jgi:hypothetical protein